MQTFELMEAEDHEPGVETSIQKWRQIERILIYVSVAASEPCGLCLQYADCIACGFGCVLSGNGNVMVFNHHLRHSMNESALILSRLLTIREAAKTVIEYEDPENDYARE